MRNKAIFLATTAVALLTGSGSAQAGDLYLSVFGGLNFQHDNSGAQTGTFAGEYNSTSFVESADTGFVIGGAIGTSLSRWAQGLKVDMEVSYRRNDIGGNWDSLTSFYDDPITAGGPINGNVSNFSILANIWYEFDLGTKARPYVGGGAGWARSKAEVIAPVTHGDLDRCCSVNSQSTTQDVNGFAWQLGAGFNYQVSPGVDVGVGYRYFRGPSFDPLFVGKNGIAVPLDNDNHSVQVNLSIGIN